MCFALFGRRIAPAKFLLMAPILAGIALCNLGDLSFTLPGFAFAILSNVFHIVKGVYSKFYFVDQLAYTGLSIFFLSVLGSSLISLPTLLVSHQDALVLVSSGRMVGLVLASSVAYAANSYAAFSVMSLVVPWTYSVFNIEKRVFVVAASWVLAGQWPTLLTLAGLLLSSTGLYFYLVA